MIVLPPASGLRGLQLREARATDYGAVMALVEGAMRAALGRDGGWVDIQALYPDRVVVRRDGRLYAYPYSIAEDNSVTLGTPEEVVTAHLPTAIREALADGGRRWLIRVIDVGASRNGRDYPADVLREAAPLFEGARVLIKSDEEHLAGKGKDARNLIGKLTAPRFVEASAAGPAGIDAELVLIDDALATKLREAADLGALDLFQFSIDASGAVDRKARPARVKKITKVASVDLIVEASAGGRVHHLIEAVQPNPQETSDMALRERMIEAIRLKAPALLVGLNPDDDDKLTEAYNEALRLEAAAKSAAPGTAPGTAADTRLELRLARSEARALIEAAHLPRPAKDRLIEGLQQRALDQLDEAPIREAIKAEVEYLGAVAPGGLPDLGWTAGAAAETTSRHEKLCEALDAFFADTAGGPQSIRELYVGITGDRRVTGRVDACDARRLREAAGPQALREALDTTAFANVLGAALQRRMIADYATPSQYDVWRKLVSTTPVNDFRTNERTRFGGYGDLPIVAQNGAYAALTSPGDEKATYAVAKRGGTETVSLEAIRNDDVGAIRQVPIKMSRAAKRTLSKFALDFLRTNPTIYDSVALFHATHNNLGSTALSATTWAAARLAVLKQTEAGSSDRLGIPLRYLWVPSDLEQTAADLFVRDTNNDPKWVQRTAPEVVGVWYWTDANDWCASTDPMDLPTIEIGFLDGNQEPEMFVQDLPTVGSLFSNDQVTYKIRHIYGGNVLDYRGLYKAVVA